MSLESFLFKLVTQIAGRNKKNTVTKLRSILIIIFAFNEKIPSKSKNDVTNVITKLTLLAARKSAIVRTLETVIILAVNERAYIPMPYITTTGIRATATDGNRNQKDPTPNVNSAGRINTNSVASLWSSSESDQIKRITEASEIIPIPSNRFIATCEAVTKNATESTSEEVTNF